MSAVNHLVLTKFNILMSADHGAAAKRLEDDWLRQRLIEFERFTVPSIRSQDSREFRWLVFCDAESPSWFKDHMSERFGDVLDPLWVTDMRNATLGRVLQERGYTDERRLVTTRIDNDDAMSRDYVATVQRHAALPNRTFLNFPRGLRSSNGALFRGYWQSNPFMSLIEEPRPDGTPFASVFIQQHHLVRKTERIVNVQHAPTWLRAMHAGNTVQTHVGLPMLDDRSDRFDVHWDSLPPAPRLSRKFGISLQGYVARVQRSKKVQSAANVLQRKRGAS